MTRKRLQEGSQKHITPHDICMTPCMSNRAHVLPRVRRAELVPDFPLRASIALELWLKGSFLFLQIAR